MQYRLSRHDEVVAERDVLRLRVAGMENKIGTVTDMSAKKSSDRDASRSVRNASTSDLTRGRWNEFNELLLELGRRN